jgi:sterol desaturase/sphingolipid hydroxylase (fatty acid hydroxylase superfamily)
LVEYLLHRFVFHFDPKNEKQADIKFKIHGVHHAYPRDKDRLAMPPVISIVLALFFYGLFRLILGSDVIMFFPGFLAGYSTYLIIHYAVHRFRPPLNFLKILWTHHALHHYKDENTAFAVSMPVWDYIFRTLPEKPSSVKVP